MLVASKTNSNVRSLTLHWPEYTIEAACLGRFMISSCSFGALFGHPDSPIVRLVQSRTLLRMMMGLAMGATAVALIYSPLGKRSGAHMNPATTLTFLRLGKIRSADAFFYITAQFIGAIVGVATAAWILGAPLAHPSVKYVVTRPGAYGIAGAFV